MSLLYRLRFGRKKYRADDDDDKTHYRWPKPWWQRILFFPRDIVLLHLDVPRSGWFWLSHVTKKKNSCWFCDDPSNLGKEIKRCPPATRYANLGMAKIACPCLQAPIEGVTDIPSCKETQRGGVTLRRFLLSGLLLLLIWTGLGITLYCYDPTRQFVGRVVKRRPPPIEKIRAREYNPEKAEKRLAQARELMLEKRWTEARIELLNARAYDPENVDVHRTLGELYLILRQIPLALTEFEHCYKLDPNELTHFLNFARIAIASRNHELLLPYFESAPENIARSPSFKLLHATTLYMDREIDAARTLALEVGDLEATSHIELLEAATLLLFQLSSPQGGLKLLERAAAEKPEDEQTLILLARAHRMNNNFEESERWLQRAERLGTTNPHLTIERAEHYVNAHRLAEAIKNFEYVSGRNSALSIALARLAELYLSTGKVDAAKDIANDLILVRETAPYGQGHTVLAEIALQSRFYTDAIAHAQEAIKALGSTYELEVLLARAYFAKKEMDLAIEHVENALRLSPTRPLALLTRADIYFAAGDKENGLKTIRQLGNQANLYPHQLVQLGALAARTGNYREARIAYLKVLQQQSSNLLILNQLTNVLEEEGKEIRIARQFSERLSKKLPDSVAVAQTYGRIILAEDKLEQDLSILEEHVRKFPFASIPHAQLGTAYFRLNRDADAKRELEEAIRRAPGDFEGIENVRDMLKQIDARAK